MKTFKVLVTSEVEVTLDETKFTDEFMKEYQENFSNIQSLEAHAVNLAWLHATGRIDLDYSPKSVYSPFVEGYGPAADMGITAKSLWEESEMETA